MAVNGSAAGGRFVGAELVIDPIGTVFEPLEHSPAPFRSHLISGERLPPEKARLVGRGEAEAHGRKSRTMVLKHGEI
jgi:hypothetical protein